MRFDDRFSVSALGEIWNSPVNCTNSALATRNHEYAEKDGQPIEKARLVIIEMGLLMGVNYVVFDHSAGHVGGIGGRCGGHRLVAQRGQRGGRGATAIGIAFLVAFTIATNPFN
jgi:hypothetical protein